MKSKAKKLPKEKLTMKDRIKRFRNNKELLLLTIPGAIWFLVFAYLPMFGVIVAFKRWRIHGGFFESLMNSKWVGFDNFKFLFKSSS